MIDSNDIVSVKELWNIAVSSWFPNLLTLPYSLWDRSLVICMPSTSACSMLGLVDGMSFGAEQLHYLLLMPVGFYSLAGVVTMPMHSLMRPRLQSIIRKVIYMSSIR